MIYGIKSGGNGKQHEKQNRRGSLAGSNLPFGMGMLRLLRLLCLQQKQAQGGGAVKRKVKSKW